ncbi:MAG TPA: hypothetical protein VGM03_18700, partial [Phycisphaerae bacterium]
MSGRVLAITIIGFFGLAFTHRALAGPPLICHPIEIGNAKSLPWGGGNGFDSDPKYDVKRVTADTLELLNPQTDVLVRMETMRRATLYVRENRAAALELFSALQARVLDAEAGGEPDGLAWFDAGYLAQTYAQLGIETNGKGQGPVGYDWAEKGLALRGNDPGMEFALALMTFNGHGKNNLAAERPDHDAHVRK